MTQSAAPRRRRRDPDAPASSPAALAKRATGIGAFDEITGGGLPSGRATIVVGASGTGKTIFSMQVLCHAAAARNEASIFVCFEERPDDIVRNLASFGWGLEHLVGRRIHLVDGRLPLDLRHAGDADLEGLLAALDALAKRTGAQWIVLDSLDAVLAQLPDEAARRRETVRLQRWVEGLGLSCLLTVKRGGEWGTTPPEESALSYLVDCVVDLDSSAFDALILRTLRIVKYRGSSHYPHRTPCLIGPQGFELVPVLPASTDYPVFSDRISTGIADLDAMFGGGLLRGSALLLTGAPGTSKTSIAGRFVEAACDRGETALMVSFDESPDEVVRNLTSIGVRLERHRAAGRLAMLGLAARAQSAELVFAQLHGMIGRHAPGYLVVDPVSALLKGGGEVIALGALLRIFQLCKQRGVTLLMTSLAGKADIDTESTDIHASTIADVWIHLSYLVRAGERNRLLTVVKARGTAHSNQVREILVSAEGIRLAPPYVEEGEVLAGTLRWQKEQQSARERQARAEADRQRERALADAQAELAARIAALQREYEARAAELLAVRTQRETDTGQDELQRQVLLARRGSPHAATAPATAPEPKRRGGGRR